MMRATRFKKKPPAKQQGRPKGSRTLWTAEEKRKLLRPIEPAMDYAIADLCEATGVPLRVLRRLMDQGLPFRKIGGSRFILGSDWISWTKANLETRGAS